MHIESITIKNLLSFKDAKFNFKKYNVIVGPNNAGKTNLVRILQAVIGHDIIDYDLPSKMKHDENEQSQIRLAVKATNKETRMVLQAMTDKPVGPETNLDLWRNFTIVLNWQKLDMNKRIFPTIIYFQNRIVVFMVLGKHFVSYHDPADMLDFEQYLSKLYSMDKDQTKVYTPEGSEIPMRKHDIRDLLTGNDPEKFFLSEGKCYINGSSVALNEGTQGQHKHELAEYLGLEESTNHVDLPRVVSEIMQDNFIQAIEMHPTAQDLSINLHTLKNRDEDVYNHLRESFANIFPDTTIKIGPRPNSNEQTIWITDNQKMLEITDSASGHLEAIHILHAILNHTEHTIFLDEPELHFHPAKIRQISQMLQSLTKDYNNQITIITHSPKFIDHGLLDPKSTSMLTAVTKDNGKSKVASPIDTAINLKPHMFMPDMFFVNAVFLVEGARDESVITAISNSYNGVFNKHEIIIVNCGGVGGINPYIDLLEAYSIKYYGMADEQYANNDTITVLDIDLENELQKIKTMPFRSSPNQPEKPDPEVYYKYITELLETENGREELKKTKIWSSIESAMNGIGVDMIDFEDKA